MEPLLDFFLEPTPKPLERFILEPFVELFLEDPFMESFTDPLLEPLLECLLEPLLDLPDLEEDKAEPLECLLEPLLDLPDLEDKAEPLLDLADLEDEADFFERKRSFSQWNGSSSMASRRAFKVKVKLGELFSSSEGRSSDGALVGGGGGGGTGIGAGNGGSV